MNSISIEVAKPQAKTAKQPVTEAVHQPPVIEDPLGAGDAVRFQGQPLTIFSRLERAFNELCFFKANLRHRTEAETNDPRAHDEWRRAAVALARELADEIEAGLLDPNVEIQRELEFVQSALARVKKLQANG